MGKKEKKFIGNYCVFGPNVVLGILKVLLRFLSPLGITHLRSDWEITMRLTRFIYTGKSRLPLKLLSFSDKTISILFKLQIHLLLFFYLFTLSLDQYSKKLILVREFFFNLYNFFFK